MADCMCGPLDGHRPDGHRRIKAQEGCKLHATCDDPDCRALMDPATLEEALMAVEHWRDHSYLGGCSHGC